MDFFLTDDQRLIRDTVRQFMEAEMRPHIRQWEKAEHFPAAQIRQLGEMGCCGMLIPEEWGGTTQFCEISALQKPFSLR